MMYSVTSFGFGWFLNLGLFLGLTYNLSVYVAPRMSKHFFLKNHVLRYFNMQFSKNNVVSDFGIIKLRWMLAFISCFIISKALATCQWATSSAWSFGHNVVDSLSTVEIKGFEPLTPCLQGRCSPNWAIPPYLKFSILKKFKSILVYYFLFNCFQLSGVKRTRTSDLTLIRRAL